MKIVKNKCNLKWIKHTKKIEGKKNELAIKMSRVLKGRGLSDI